MNEKIIVSKNAFDLDFCNKCLEIHAANYGTIGSGFDTSVRKSKVTFLNGAFRHVDIYKEILQFLNDVNAHQFQFDLMGMEPPQLTEYDSAYQGEYKPHKDSNIPDENNIIRKLSMVVQITPPDSYEGGVLQFPDMKDYDESTTMAQGSAIVFPSYLLHGVTPVTSGKRKSLVVWANGPAFR